MDKLEVSKKEDQKKKKKEYSKDPFGIIKT